MRKGPTLALGAVTAALAAGLAAAATSPTLVAPDGNTQSIGMTISPQRLPKAELAPITLDIRTKTTKQANPSEPPVPAVKAIIDFDKGLKIFSKGYPTCNAGDIQSDSTEAALEACKRAKIGTGDATALIRLEPKIFTEPTTVTAFNGRPQGGKPVILLHSYGQTPVQTTFVLVGVVTNFGKEGYGPRLTVNIPTIAGGAGALTEFHAKIFKKFTYKGKKRSYVSAACLTKRLKIRGKFIFKDGESLTPKTEQKCTQSG